MNALPNTVDLVSHLTDIVGADNIATSAAELVTLCHDVAGPAPVPPLCAVRPETMEVAQAAMRRIAADGAGIVPRGGGLSYSGGYGPSQAGCVLIDMSALNRIVEINTDDRYVVVEAGCSWGALDEALTGTGYRPPFFGTLSGAASTVAGAVSQNAS
ncbi:MAG: FAD-binding oxidoreductase, partial [Pseudomonadota bacterium]